MKEITYISSCSKCKKVFKWREEDLLIKHSNHSKGLIPCPHCMKLVKVYLEAAT